MKIVFFGSSEFAVPSLERLLESQHKISAVITQPDRKKGRCLKLSATPVKTLASERGVKIYQPESLEEASSLKRLKSFSADLFAVVAYGLILPKKILEIPKLYSVNLHASLLPKYRGAAPVSRAVMNGETETGLTVIRMNERMDAGDIILQRRVAIEKEDTSETLNGRLANLGAVLLADTVRFIEGDKVSFKKQDEKKATLAPRLKKEDGLIDWKKSAVEILDKIRGTVPWPGAYTYFKNKKVGIRKAALAYGEGPPGEIFEAEKELIIGTKKGLLNVLEIQAEGKRAMPAADFLRGRRDVKKGEKFGA